MPGRGMGEVIELFCTSDHSLTLVQRLAVDPNSNNILFFGARSGNGLWKSTDFGATWQKISSLPNTGMLPIS